MADAAPEIEVPTSAPAGSSQMSVLDALKGVLKLALIHDGLARGLREASKALDRRQAHMCVLNEGCEEEAYKKLVVALCAEHKIPLIKVPDGKQLGEWAGLCEFLHFFYLAFFGGIFIPVRSRREELVMVIFALYPLQYHQEQMPTNIGLPSCFPQTFCLTFALTFYFFPPPQASSTVKATRAKSSTARAWWSVIGAKNPKSGRSY